MLDLMIGIVNESPAQTPEETQVVARGLTSLIQKDDELSLSAQVIKHFTLSENNLNHNYKNYWYKSTLRAQQSFSVQSLIF